MTLRLGEPFVGAPATRAAPGHWFVRRLIRTGCAPGTRGAVGRWLGRTWGAPIPGGLHFLVTSPSEAIQSLLLANGLYEPATCAILDALVRDGRRLVYDVGANAGQHTLVAVAAGARVVAFEPLPRLADALRANVRRNRALGRVLVVARAVAASTGEAPLYVAHRSDDGSHSLLAGVEADQVDRVLVPTTSLDAFVREHPRLRPSLVKVDVEGAESRVLDGAADLLASPDRPDWIVETSDALTASIGESAARVLERLSRHGYRLYRIEENPAALHEVRPASDYARLGNYLAVPTGRRLPRLRPLAPCAGSGWLG